MGITMKEIEAKVSFLINADHESMLEVIDAASGEVVVQAQLTPEQIVQLLSRRARVDAHSASVGELSRVGCTPQRQSVCIHMPQYSVERDRQDQVDEAVREFMDENSYADDGWVCSTYCGSQGSFTYELEGRVFNTTMTRWVDEDGNPVTP